MFDRQNPVIEIFLENAKTLADRREIFSLTEAEMRNVNDNMVNKLFNSALEKSHVDFDDIPKSKGDITKYSGYKSMVECLDVLRNLSIKAGNKIEEIEIVEKAIDGIIANRNVFERGIKLNKDFVIMQYNTLVMACVIATSSLIVSYVDYMKKIDNIEFTIINPKSHPGKMCIESLAKFNRSVNSGEFIKTMNGIVSADSEGFVGTGAIIAGAVIIGAIALVVSMRDIIFYTYYSRVKLAEYLRTQALFLELNKNTINSNSYKVSAGKKEQVLRKQAELIEKLKKAANNIDVSDKLAETNARKDMKKENSGWKLGDVKTQSVSTDQSGFQLI